MHPAKETAGADIPLPMIKEMRPQPLRDAEALSTQTDEREVQHMNLNDQTKNPTEVSRYESIR